jgi:hypothetical protein
VTTDRLRGGLLEQDLVLDSSRGGLLERGSRGDIGSCRLSGSTFMGTNGVGGRLGFSCLNNRMETLVRKAD